MTICTVCKGEFGHCDVEVHEEQLDPGYCFDLTQPVETRYYDQSISPKLSETYINGRGITVAKVAAIALIANG